LLAVEEITDYAVFLSSDKAKDVTVQAVVLDGSSICLSLPIRKTGQSAPGFN
jgi:hypothetical protein